MISSVEAPIAPTSSDVSSIERDNSRWHLGKYTSHHLETQAQSRREGGDAVGIGVVDVAAAAVDGAAVAFAATLADAAAVRQAASAGQHAPPPPHNNPCLLAYPKRRAVSADFWRGSGTAE